MKAGLLLITCMLLSAILAFSDRFRYDSPDKEFVLAAADGGMLEVRLGELAKKNASRQNFKDFANVMIEDHSKVNAELKQLAGKKQITIPAKLSKAKQQLYDSLAATKGEQFDMLYMNMMIASHEETVGLFSRSRITGRIPTLKSGRIPKSRH